MRRCAGSAGCMGTWCSPVAAGCVCICACAYVPGLRVCVGYVVSQQRGVLALCVLLLVFSAVRCVSPCGRVDSCWYMRLGAGRACRKAHPSAAVGVAQLQQLYKISSMTGMNTAPACSRVSRSVVYLHASSNPSCCLVDCGGSLLIVAAAC